MTRRRYTIRMLIVGVVAALLLAACGDDEVTGSPVELATDAVVLDEQFSPVEPGTYRVETAGTPFTFTTDEPLFVQPNGKGEFVLTAPDSGGPGDRDIVVLRLSQLSDPKQPNILTSAVENPWPAKDFGGWLDNLSEAIEVTDREATTLGGRDATRATLRVGDIECGAIDPLCVDLGTNLSITGKSLDPGIEYRTWFLEQGEHDPLAVIVGVEGEGDADWFDTVDAIFATMAIGDPAPNPVVSAPAGAVELEFFGGVTSELVRDSVIVEEPRGFGRIAVQGQIGDTEFLRNPLDTDGEPIETSAALRTALEEAGVVVDESTPTQIAGIDGEAFDIAGSRSADFVLQFFDDAPNGWYAPPKGRMWSIEHPERGLLVMTAWAWEDFDTVYPEVVRQAESLIGSLEFIQ